METGKSTPMFPRKNLMQPRRKCFKECMVSTFQALLAGMGKEPKLKKTGRCPPGEKLLAAAREDPDVADISGGRMGVFCFWNWVGPGLGQRVNRGRLFQAIGPGCYEDPHRTAGWIGAGIENNQCYVTGSTGQTLRGLRPHRRRGNVTGRRVR